MGLRDSPYRPIQLLTCLKIEAFGDRWDRSNPFHWERVIYNMHGTNGYQPGLLWVIKVRFEGHLECEVYVYMDDGRVTNHCRELCWVTGRRFTSVCSNCGVQDAARKWTFSADGPGSWAGTVCHTSGGEIIGTVSQEKWENT